MLASMRCFSYTPHASSSEVFDYILELVLVRCFSYTSHTSFSEVFLLHPHASFNEVFLL